MYRFEKACKKKIKESILNLIKQNYSESSLNANKRNHRWKRSTSMFRRVKRVSRDFSPTVMDSESLRGDASVRLIKILGRVVARNHGDKSLKGENRSSRPFPTGNLHRGSRTHLPTGHAPGRNSVPRSNNEPDLNNFRLPFLASRCTFVCTQGVP